MEVFGLGRRVGSLLFHEACSLGVLGVFSRQPYFDRFREIDHERGTEPIHLGPRIAVSCCFLRPREAGDAESLSSYTRTAPAHDSAEVP